MKEGRFRWLSAKDEEERARKIEDQRQCKFKLHSEWVWRGKKIMMFERDEEQK